MSTSTEPRVVITGIGVVSPFGVGRERFWDSVRDGVSGTRAVTAFDVDVPARFPEGPGAGVRLEERPPLLDSLWVSAPRSGERS